MYNPRSTHVATVYAKPNRRHSSGPFGDCQNERKKRDGSKLCDVCVRPIPTGLSNDDQTHGRTKSHHSDALLLKLCFFVRTVMVFVGNQCGIAGVLAMCAKSERPGVAVVTPEQAR